MADVVKWLTHWIVAPTRAGSIPVMRPILKNKSRLNLLFLFLYIIFINYFNNFKFFKYYFHIFIKFTLTPLFKVDAPILTHNPTISSVIRLGLCADCVKCRYINRLTVFSWYEMGKQWRTTATCSPNKHRLIYIYNQSMSYAHVIIFFSDSIIGNANREW